VIDRLKQDQKKLTTEMAGLEQLNHGIERWGRSQKSNRCFI